MKSFYLFVIIILILFQGCNAQENQKDSFVFYYSNDNATSFTIKGLLNIYKKNSINIDSTTQRSISFITSDVFASSKLIDSIFFYRNMNNYQFKTIIKQGNRTPIRITSTYITQNDSVIYKYYLFPGTYKDKLTNMKVNNFLVKYTFYNGKIAEIIKSIERFNLFYYMTDNKIDSIFSKRDGNKIGLEYQSSDDLERLICHCNNKIKRVNYKRIPSQENFYENCCGVYPYYWYLGSLQNYGIWVKKSSILYPYIPYAIEGNYSQSTLDFELEYMNVILINEK